MQRLTHLTLLFALGSLGSASAAEPGLVIEGANLNFDPASNTVIAAPCFKCKPLLLKLTDETAVFVDGKKQPFTADTEFEGPVDTMYRPDDMTVIWFRPLAFRR